MSDAAAPASPALPFRLVGLTGGIASGKSTVTARLMRWGLTLLDADKIAREVVEPGTEGLRAVVDAFGPDVLTADGALDRPKLGARVFSDPQARAKLDRILHPRIAQQTALRTQQAQQRGAPLVIYDAPLIVENRLHAGMHALVVVALDPDTQRARLMARDGYTRAEAQQRIDAQLPLADKVAVADVVIDNSGDRAATDAQVDALVRGLPARLWPEQQAEAQRWLDALTPPSDDAAEAR